MRLPLLMHSRLAELEARSAKQPARQAQQNACRLFERRERATTIAIWGGTDEDPCVMRIAEQIREMRRPVREEHRQVHQEASEHIRRMIAEN